MGIKKNQTYDLENDVNSLKDMYLMIYETKTNVIGKKQDYLKNLFGKHFGFGSHIRPSSTDLLNSTHSPLINEVYYKLNGQLSIPPTRFGSWDINLKNFIIELDEERHFNEYRLLTLNTSLYSNWKYFNTESYKIYCTHYQNECLKSASWGKNWKNDSTEKQFGISNEPKNLSENGSSRWKQRAFYDFLKDVSSLTTGVPVIRISVYDKIGSIHLDEAINKQRNEHLIEFIEKQIKNTANIGT